MKEIREFKHRHRHFKKGATKEDVLPILQKAKKDFGGGYFNATQYTEWRKINGGPTTITIKKLFGSFEEALQSIGIALESKEELLELAKKDLGRMFTRAAYEEWRKDHKNAPSSQTLCKECGGTWNDVAATYGFLAKQRTLASYSA